MTVMMTMPASRAKWGSSLHELRFLVAQAEQGSPISKETAEDIVETTVGEMVDELHDEAAVWN